MKRHTEAGHEGSTTAPAGGIKDAFADQADPEPNPTAPARRSPAHDAVTTQPTTSASPARRTRSTGPTGARLDPPAATKGLTEASKASPSPNGTRRTTSSATSGPAGPRPPSSGTFTSRCAATGPTRPTPAAPVAAAYQDAGSAPKVRPTTNPTSTRGPRAASGTDDGRSGEARGFTPHGGSTGTAATKTGP